MIKNTINVEKSSNMAKLLGENKKNGILFSSFLTSSNISRRFY